MTRRQFGAVVFGGMSITRISSSPERSSKQAGTFKNHVQNARLFGLAAGDINLTKPERQHLHECEVCQQIACVFIYQLVYSSR